MILTIDTSVAIPELGPTSTAADYALRVMLMAAESWRKIHGGTRDQALQSALEAVRPDAAGRVGVRQQIRNEATRRKSDGGFLTTGNGPKWLSSDTPTIALIGMLGTQPAADVANLRSKALDGTNYNWTLARVLDAGKALLAQWQAIETVETNALASQAANPAGFDFAAIVWPAQYVAP